MPTYQYACTACGHQLEAVQSFTDEPLSDCPSCEGRLRKVFNSVGIVFKGSGFYRTDSRGGDGKGAASNGSSTGSEKSTTEKKDSAAASGSGSTSGSGSASGSGSSSNGGTASGGSTPAGSTSTKAPAGAGSAS
ncbi:zinc ribbon domain-containing protein [Solwaraspora sp. WMMD791]|uniref:FmdB family zinc ribbon protein n=1 Tax=Solwaraspora sp. WMMD791 TaxID=3016086 RepID=UPI00249BAE97|nr:FmdB family zinc ribbon protein [Solwaraspora sp. WMMD791]WFE26547.1 zinc ribbon domain-containing protein [Solwaraspora sp. WMMD791]